MCESGRQGLTLASSIVLGFKLGRRDVPYRFEESTVVEPVDPRQRRQFDILKTLPGTPTTDDLGLEQPDHRLGHRVVVENIVGTHPIR